MSVRKKPGSSLEKNCLAIPYPPVAMVTGELPVGAYSAVTPMDAPAQRPSMTIGCLVARKTLFAAPTELVLPETTGVPETRIEQPAYTPPPL